MNLRSMAKKKFKVTTDSEHTKPIYDNILNRDFTTKEINQTAIDYKAPIDVELAV